MAIIYSYPRIDTVSGTDIMVLADSSEEDFATKSVTMAQLKTFFGSGGGGNAIKILYEGALVTDAVTDINFTGAGVNISNSTTKVTVNIPGGGGGGNTYLLGTDITSPAPVKEVDLNLIDSTGSPSTIVSTVKFSEGFGIEITEPSPNYIQIGNLNGLLVDSGFILVQDHPTNPGEKQLIPDLTYRKTFRQDSVPNNRGIIFSPLPPGTVGDYVYTDVDTAAGLDYDDGVGGTGKIQVKLGTGLGFDGSGNIEATSSFTPGETFTWFPTLCSNGASITELGQSDLDANGIITITNRVGNAYTTNDPAWIRYEFYLEFTILQAWSNAPPLSDYLIIARRDIDAGKTLQLSIDSANTIGSNLRPEVNGSIQITKASAQSLAAPTYMWNRVPQAGTIALEGTTYVGYLASLNYKGGVGASGLEYVYDNGVNWWGASAINTECVLAGTIIAHPV